MSDTTTFRSLLTGTVAEFLEDAGMPCTDTQSALAGLVVALADYREEGVPLFPEVFFCDSLDTTVRALQARDPVPIGSGPRSAETVRQAVKKCAPLARGGWSIYVHRTLAAFEYGLFRSMNFALSESPLEALRASIDRELRAFCALQISPGVIELRASCGRHHLIHLTDARATAPSPLAHFDKLSDALVAAVEGPAKEKLRGFYRRLLVRTTQGSHGTLVAVVPSRDTIPTVFEDGTFLKPPMDLTAKIAEYSKTSHDEESVASLLGCSELISGMLSSDGITLFSADGHVLGYNFFISLPPLSGKEAAAVHGGARRRTYRILCDNLTKGLSSAFYRSHDGATECRRSGGDG